MRSLEDRFNGLMIFVLELFKRVNLLVGATSVPPTIGSSKRIVRRAISLLPPTTLPALPTTTPTRATAEATHRAEEASQDTKAPSLRFCK
uniref:Uncharacterized protein n=2 Tax=Oryza sativa subsp. japonica TaxID=39947 RepID=Q8LMB5_ORYSJ|nr:Hypothetical protein [Oryza sativa Japonica Group]AAP53132.1 hypothetical protein LOC_Os10g20080 [Oryza sativa Japonica Group]